VKSPERAAQLLVAGTLDRSVWSELEDEEFAAEVGRRLGEVGLELVGANGRWLARPLDAEGEDGFEPIFHLHSVQLAMAAALYLHLRYLPHQAEALETGAEAEPSVEVEDVLAAFDGYDKLYLERMVLGHLRNAGFVRREGGRLYAGPYLAAINEIDADARAQKALEQFTIRRYLRRRASEIEEGVDAAD
jgi:hypothetical protein